MLPGRPWELNLLGLPGLLLFPPELAGKETLQADPSHVTFCLFFPCIALVVAKAPPLSTTAGSQSPPETPVLTRSSSQTPTAGVTATTSTTSTVMAPAATATGSPVKKQRPLLPKETAPAVQRVVWNSSSKFQTSSQKWHMQKMQRQQQPPQSQQQQPQSSQGTRYQTRQAVKGTEPPFCSPWHPRPFCHIDRRKKKPKPLFYFFQFPFVSRLSRAEGRTHSTLALFFKIVLQLDFLLLFKILFYFTNDTLCGFSLERGQDIYTKVYCPNGLTFHFRLLPFSVAAVNYKTFLCMYAYIYLHIYDSS